MGDILVFHQDKHYIIYAVGDGYMDEQDYIFAGFNIKNREYTSDYLGYQFKKIGAIKNANICKLLTCV